MSEVYRGSTNNIYLSINGAQAQGSVEAYVVDSPPRMLPVTGPTQNGPVQRWTASVGFNETLTIGPRVIEWSFTVNGIPATKKEYIDVVVPLVDISDIREELEIPPNISNGQIIRAERRVRRMIENYTGQKFEPVEKTVRVRVDDNLFIRLPYRLEALTSVTVGNQALASSLFFIDPDGWTLQSGASYRPDTTYMSPVPIVGPYHEWDRFKRGGTFVNVTGLWGWSTVPSAVQESALLLIEQQLCPDTVYRERYIKTMTAADWRIEFNSNAYIGTGNVIADHLLKDYRVTNMAVI